MSLASHLAPPGRQATIDETRHAQGAHGVVDLIVGTLTNRRLRHDADIDEHLAALKDACRQTRRYREALPVLHRIATLNPRRRHEMAAEIALMHRHLGEHDLAIAVLEAAVTQQRSLPAWKRSLAFALVAEIAATVLGRRELAVECAQLGRSSVTPAPRSARAAATGRGVKPAAAKAFTPDQRPASGAPAAGPSVGRRRAKGPVRQLSVLTAAGEPTLAEAGLAKSARPQLTVVGGTAA
jgi:tetratricopeptide (TPR) repeat protein